MYIYLDLLQDILKNGTQKSDRTATGTISVFGRQLRFDLKNGFPLVTTKKIHWKSVVHELLWMIRGNTNVKYLNDHGVTIWDEWADEDGNLGPIYGYQWRYGHIDQLKYAIDTLKRDPDSRRIIVSAWNVADLQSMALHPCHFVYQFYSKEKDGKRYLSCHVNIRSNDIFLGTPFNIASYALLTHLIAQVTDHEVDELIYTIGDAHIYKNHIDQVYEQLNRTPYDLPTIKLNQDIKSIDDFEFEDIELIGYKSHKRIKAEISI